MHPARYKAFTARSHKLGLEQASIRIVCNANMRATKDRLVGLNGRARQSSARRGLWLRPAARRGLTRPTRYH